MTADIDRRFLEIISHLGAALIQQAACDDKIIMDHVREASEIAKRALKSGLLGE